MVSVDHLRLPLSLVYRPQVVLVACQRPLKFEARVGGQVRCVVEDPGCVADLFAEEVRGRSVRGQVVGFAGALVSVVVVGL